jgi:hypothetical protein
MFYILIPIIKWGRETDDLRRLIVSLLNLNGKNHVLNLVCVGRFSFLLDPWSDQNLFWSRVLFLCLGPLDYDPALAVARTCFYRVQFDLSRFHFRAVPVSFFFLCRSNSSLPGVPGQARLKLSVSSLHAGTQSPGHQHSSLALVFVFPRRVVSGRSFVRFVGGLKVSVFNSVSPYLLGPVFTFPSWSLFLLLGSLVAGVLQLVLLSAVGRSSIPHCGSNSFRCKSRFPLFEICLRSFLSCVTGGDHLFAVENSRRLGFKFSDFFFVFLCMDCCRWRPDIAIESPDQKTWAFLV